MMDWHDGAGWGWGGWLVMGLMMLLVWGAVVAVLVAVFRAVRSGASDSGAGAPAQPRRSDAMQLLEERFARGEIDEQEFRARRDALRSSPGHV